MPPLSLRTGTPYFQIRSGATGYSRHKTSCTVVVEKVTLLLSGGEERGSVVVLGLGPWP